MKAYTVGGELDPGHTDTVPSRPVAEPECGADLACKRIALAMANRLWISLDVDALGELVDDEHVPGEDGEPAVFTSLWDAVVSMCFTVAVANRGRDIPLLQGEPMDKHRPGSMQ